VADDTGAWPSQHSAMPAGPPKRIIAPVTFANDTLDAVVFAATLAASLGAELILAGIAPLAPPEPAVNGPTPTETILRRVEEQKLVDQIVGERIDELRRALPDDVPVRTLLTWGPVGIALVDAAREQRADLVVIPMRRAHELAHLVHDHGDRYVLHHSDVPVLVVPTNAHG
jgi:nucleotide-binding universal stress UspA family protein